MDQIEIPTFDDSQETTGYNFGGFGTSDESSFGAFGNSPFGAGPPPFAGSTSFGRPRGDSNPIPPPGVINSARKGSFANVSNSIQQHVRNKSASNHKSGNSQDRGYGNGMASPAVGISNYPPVPSLSQSQSSKRDSLPPIPVEHVPLHAPLETAAYLVLAAFFEKADDKISDALNRPIDHDVYLPTLLGEGVDPAFDDLLRSIAHIGKKLPKLVIDLVMNWRKDQSEAVDSSTVSRTMALSAQGTSRTVVGETLSSRKALASIYILCRSLSAVVGSVSREGLGVDLANVLEDIIFNSLKNADPSQVARSANRKANMDMYARLMGKFSVISFVSVSDRFLADLDQIRRGLLPKEIEPRLEFLILGMRFLKLQIYPMEAFEDAAEFMGVLASIFDASSGGRIKISLATVLTALLSPVSSATAEVNQPVWAQATQTIYVKATQMATKPRYVACALPIICASAAASPEEQLLNNFNSCTDLCLNRLKDRALRPAAMYGILQLMYAYLRRCHESHSAVAKRLDAIVRFILPLGRKQLNPPDLHLKAPATLLQFIAHRHFEYGSELILSVINPSPAVSSDRWPFEALAPERMHVAVKAVLLTLDCLEKNAEPDMPAPPQPDDNGYFEEVDYVDDKTPAPSVAPLPESILSRSGMRTFVGGCMATIAKIAMACDRASEPYSVLDDRNIVPRGAAPPPFSPDREAMYYRRHGAFQVCYPRERQPVFDLLRCCIDSWPRLLSRDPAMIEFKPLEIILRGLVHVDVDVYQSSRSALIRLASQQDGHQVVKALSKFVVRPELVLREIGTLQGAATVKLESLVKLWIEVIAAWQNTLHEYSNLASTSMLGQISKRPGMAAPLATDNIADHPFSGIDPHQLLPLLNDIEASGVVLMLSQSALLRRWAVEAFSLAKDCHSILGNLSNDVCGTPMLNNGVQRVHEELERSASLLDEIDEDALTSGEKSCLNKWRKTPADKTLTKLIESDSPLDLALWHHLIPVLMTAFNHLLPNVISLARTFLVNRLYRANPAASSAAGLVPSKVPQTPLTTRSGMPSTVLPMDITFLADHWKTHLMSLCAITSNTSPTAAPISHDADKFNSGAELVRLGVPFLASDNSALRDATVQGLGCVHPALYKPLLEGLHSIVRHLAEDRRVRVEQRTGGKRSARHSRLFIAVAFVQEASSKLLRSEADRLGDAEVSLVAQYVKEAFAFLKEPEFPEEASLLPMRRAFCICVHNLVVYCSHEGSIRKWLSNDLRHDIFSLFDSWSFRPMTIQSPEMGRSTMRSTDSHPSHHRHNKGRASSSSSQVAGCEVFLPAVNAMATFCEQGAISIRKDGADRASGLLAQDVLKWAQALLEAPQSSGHASVRRALGGLVSLNLENRTFLDATVVQCFVETDNFPLTQSTFSVLSGALIAEPHIAIKSSTAVCLALWKLGHADLPTRQRALDILITRLPPGFRKEIAGICEPAIYSTFGGSLLQARLYLCEKLAAANLVDGRAVFLELAIRILQVEGKQTRLLLQLLPSWLKVALPQANVKTTDSAQISSTPAVPSTDSVLANLFIVSARFVDMYQIEVRSMWLALAGEPGSDNFQPVLQFLVQETARRGSKDFTKIAQRIIGCLCNSTNAAAVLTYLSSYIQPSEILDLVDRNRSEAPVKRTNLDSYFPISPRRMALSSAQAALLIAGDAVVTRMDAADPNIARVLHMLLVHIDHTTAFIRQQARDILARLATLLQKLDKRITEASVLPASRLAEVLWSWRHFWEHDDTATSPDRKGPPNMDKLLEDFLDLLQTRIPDLSRLWAAVALEWATSCLLRHMACRSLQVFRLLTPTIDQRMLAEMLARLADSVSDQSGDSHVFAQEILLTLTTIVNVCPTPVLEDVPHLFWGSLACLESGNENEVALVCAMATNAIERLEQLSSNSIKAIASVKPEQLDIPGMLRHLAWRAFASTTTMEPAWAFFTILASSAEAATLIPLVSSFHLMLPIALLYGLQALETGETSVELISFTEGLAALATANDQHSMARIMTSLGKNRFRSKEDLIRQSINCMAECSNAEQRIEIFVFLLGALNNPLEWVRIRVLTILKAYARQVNLDEAQIDDLGSDLLRPLLRLLQSNLAPLVLEVLDEKIPIPHDTAGKTNGYGQSHVNGSRPSTASSRRPGHLPDTENVPLDTRSLIFGEPSSTGWCLPDPSQGADAVRTKLRALVESCGVQGKTSADNSPFEFATEDDQFATENDFSFSDTRSQVDGDASVLGDMVSTLHDLSSFFDEPEDLVSPAYRMSQTYGKTRRVAQVLARSYKMPSAPSTPTGRTPFLAAFAEPHLPLAREPSFEALEEEDSDNDASREETSDGQDDDADVTI